MRRTGDLDAKDREILALLEADARRSVSEIGRLTGLSAPTVTERIARLKDIGVIRRFATQIDYAKVGLPTGAIIEFKPHMNKDAKAYEFACGREEVRDIYLVTGSALMVLIVRLADNVLLNDLLHRTDPVRRDQDLGHPQHDRRMAPGVRARFAGARRRGEGLKEDRACGLNFRIIFPS